MHGSFCTENFLYWATTCRTWPVTTYQILHTHNRLHVHEPGVWNHNRVHMYLVVGLSKLGITSLCEEQGCKISAYTAASALGLFRKCLPLPIWGKEKLVTLVSRPTCCLWLVFAAPGGGVKSSFYCMCQLCFLNFYTQTQLLCRCRSLSSWTLP